MRCVMTPSEARAVLAELIEAAAGSVGAREMGFARLAALHPLDLVRMDDNARSGWWDGPPWSARRWDQKDLVADDGLVAAVGSMHPDGRVRQRAVQVLADRPGALSAALLALRVVDHVPQIRQDALPGLGSLTSAEEARAALPVLLAVARRTHGPVAQAEYTGALLGRQDGERVLRELADSVDRRIRRWAFGVCLDRSLLTVADLHRAAQDRHDQVVRRAGAERLAVVAPDGLRALLTGRYADGRVVALTRLPNEELTDAELRVALLDRSTRVRDTARWRAGRRGLDVLAVYREVLSTAGPDGASPRAVVASLAGLGRDGDSGDLAAIERRLDDPRPSVRAAAVRALTARTDPGEKSDRLGGLLLDSSPSVAVAAAEALAVASPVATSDAEALAWASAQPWSRRAAWRLGHARGGWARVEADLRAAAEPDPALAEVGRTSLLNWLTTSAATTWHRPHAVQIDRLAALLPAAQLDPDTARLVAFHVGLPWQPDQAAEPSGRESPPAPVARRRSWRDWFSGPR
jgi:hypothetical protein